MKRIIQLHDVVRFEGVEHVVIMINESRARIVPLIDKIKGLKFHDEEEYTSYYSNNRFVGGSDISPNSYMEIIGKHNFYSKKRMVKNESRSI